MLLAALHPTAPRRATNAANQTIPAAPARNQNAPLHPLFPWSGVARKVPPTLTKAPPAATKLPPNKKKGACTPKDTRPNRLTQAQHPQSQV